VVIIQNNIGNHFSPTVIIAAITAKMAKAKLPTHVEVGSSDLGLLKDSVVLLEQIRTIDKSRLIQKLGALDDEVMRQINFALLVSLDLSDYKDTP
ncbi:MAG TPA: PemK family transcriptional regulator, partial [Clostridiales bacterium UBA8960]|nr:PemK family transcriptional regulator [Clostridiales bacterium UBA8960]